MEQETDVIVLGAGPVGENVADYAHRGGLECVVVEQELVGGECSYWACMPSKALLRPGDALEAAQAVDGSRQAVHGGLDAAAVLKRRDSFTHNWDDSGQVQWLEGAGLTLVRGHGRLAGPRTVEVDGPDGRTTVRARAAVVICTGSEALVPPIPGLREAEPWTSREITAAQAAPRRLLVLGGGVVGCEMAQAWHRLGTEEVTIVQRAERLVPGMEPEASKRLLDAFRAAGITVHLDGGITAVRREGSETVAALTGGTEVRCDAMLVAAGRAPRTADIGLDTIGLEPGAWLTVDDACRVTGVDGGWLFAAGDCNHRALLTHMGKYQARLVGAGLALRARGRAVDEAAWGEHAATADIAAVPQVMFTAPQLASVGLTEAAARERGFDVRTVDYEIGNIAGASLLADDYNGWARLVIDRGRRVLLGATFVGQDVAELVHSATVAVVGEVPLARLWHAVPSYPTVSEIWLRLLETERQTA